MSEWSDLAQLRERFAEADEFRDSDLYTELAHVVAQHDDLVRLAAGARAGQVRTFLFFGAVHYLLLTGVDHPLARYYPSLVGDAAPAAHSLARSEQSRSAQSAVSSRCSHSYLRGSCRHADGFPGSRIPNV